MNSNIANTNENKKNIQEPPVLQKTSSVARTFDSDATLCDGVLKSCDDLQKTLESAFRIPSVSKLNNYEVKTIIRIHQALNSFNKNFEEFLRFMVLFVEEYSIDRDLYILFTICLLFDHPEYYFKHFDSNVFSSSELAHGQEYVIKMFIKEAKEYTRNNNH